MRRLLKMPTPSGIGAGQTATVNLPLGPTYERLAIRLRADHGSGVVEVTPANLKQCIGDIRLMVDGNTKIEISADHLVKMNAFDGFADSNGLTMLHLSDRNARTINGEDTTSYGTAGGMASFTFELDLKTGITVESLEIYAEQSKAKPFGSHKRIQRYSDNMSLVGELEISDIARGDYVMKALHLTTAEVDKVEVIGDGQKFHESDKITRNALLKLNKRTPQAGFTHLDFGQSNRVGHLLPMMLNDFRVKADFTTGDQSFNIYAVSIQPGTVAAA